MLTNFKKLLPLCGFYKATGFALGALFATTCAKKQLHITDAQAKNFAVNYSQFEHDAYFWQEPETMQNALLTLTGFKNRFTGAGLSGFYKILYQEDNQNQGVWTEKTTFVSGTGFASLDLTKIFTANQEGQKDIALKIFAYNDVVNASQSNYVAEGLVQVLLKKERKYALHAELSRFQEPSASYRLAVYADDVPLAQLARYFIAVKINDEAPQTLVNWQEKEGKLYVDLPDNMVALLERPYTLQVFTQPPHAILMAKPISKHTDYLHKCFLWEEEELLQSGFLATARIEKNAQGKAAEIHLPEQANLPNVCLTLFKNLEALFFGKRPISPQELQTLQQYVPHAQVVSCQDEAEVWRKLNIPEHAMYSFMHRAQQISKTRIDARALGWTKVNAHLACLNPNTLDVVYLGANPYKEKPNRERVQKWLPGAELDWDCPTEAEALETYPLNLFTKSFSHLNSNLYYLILPAEHKITHLPDIIGCIFQNFAVFSITDNDLESISPKIKNLRVLKLFGQITLTNNKIKRLPDEFGFVKAGILSLNYNQLTEIPTTVSLNNFMSIYLSGNSFSEVQKQEIRKRICPTGTCNVFNFNI